MSNTLNNNFVKSLSDVLKTILAFKNNSDKIVTDFFTQNRNLNAFERKIAVETIYSVIRNYHKITAIIDKKQFLDIIGLCWSKILELNPEIYAKIDIIDFSKLANLEFKDNELSTTELPNWLIEKLSVEHSKPNILTLAAALNSRAPVDLRVNTIKTKLEKVVEILTAERIDYQLCPFSPFGIRLNSGGISPKHHLITSGMVEIQDESSQLAGLLLSPKRGSMVIDFCAGSGGKALLFGMLMRNTGRIYAFDTNQRRLNNLTPRLEKSGLDNIHPELITNETDNKIKRFHNKADYVFVDAPCSGLGTLRRNPELKFSLNEEKLAKLCEEQLSILTAASKLVKSGGVIVYATCSILHAENQAVVEKFLAANADFKLTPVTTILKSPQLSREEGYLVLLPHTTHTDGFFAARIERNK